MAISESQRDGTDAWSIPSPQDHLSPSVILSEDTQRYRVSESKNPYCVSESKNPYCYIPLISGHPERECANRRAFYQPSPEW